MALQYKKPDRVPVAPLVCGASARVLGVTMDEWSKNADVAVKSLVQAHDIIGMDAFVTLVDLSVEAADWGQEVVYPLNSTAYTNTANPIIKTHDDYYRLEKINPRETPRMKHVIDMVKGLVEAKGKEVAVVGFVYGPLGVLSQLRGHERLFMDCVTDPDAVMAAEDIITDVLVEFAKAQAEAGAHSICLDTLYSSGSIMSKALWEKIEAPFAKRVADAIRDTGCILTLHNCGNDIYFDVQQKWLNPVGISHAYPADDCGKDWTKHAEKWGKQIVTIGYAVPSNTGLSMTEAEIMEDSRKQIEMYKNCDGGFILATGCEFPPNGSLKSAMAMVKAAKTYGSYV